MMRILFPGYLPNLPSSFFKWALWHAYEFLLPLFWQEALAHIMILYLCFLVYRQGTETGQGRGRAMLTGNRKRHLASVDDNL